MGMLNFYDLGC